MVCGFAFEKATHSGLSIFRGALLISTSMQGECVARRKRTEISQPIRGLDEALQALRSSERMAFAVSWGLRFASYLLPFVAMFSSIALAVPHNGTYKPAKTRLIGGHAAKAASLNPAIHFALRRSGLRGKMRRQYLSTADRGRCLRPSVS